METNVNNKCKAFTSLEQSKKLAEILPLESADMYYESECNLPKLVVGSYILHLQCMEDKDYKKLSNTILSPAWSLVALMDIIPNCGVEKNELGLYKCKCSYPYITNAHNHAVDACYEMILKLNELDLL